MAPPFFPQRKGGQKRQGGNPLNPQVTLSIFFSGKSTRTILPKPTRIKREPRGPRGPVGRGTENMWRPKAWGRGPLCIVGFYDNGGEILLKREPTGSPGVRGNPGGVFASFCRRGQKEVAAHWTVFCQNCVLYARTNHEAVFLYALMPRGTPFLSAKKGEKEASGGKAP